MLKGTLVWRHSSSDLLSGGIWTSILSPCTYSERMIVSSTSEVRNSAPAYYLAELLVVCLPCCISLGADPQVICFPCPSLCRECPSSSALVVLCSLAYHL